MSATTGLLQAGTVTDFDLVDGLGLIDADNGDIVFFSLRNLNACHVSLLDVGTRVRFASHADEFGVHADSVSLTDC